MTSDNIVLRTLGCFTRSRAVAVGSVYGVDVLSASMCSRHHTPALGARCGVRLPALFPVFWACRSLYWLSY